MSIMIKGAEMPKGCAECPCILEEWMCGAKGLYVHNELINPFKERPSWCPLAEVVRCKDCVKRHNGCPMQVWCGTGDADYCSRGELKQDD